MQRASQLNTVTTVLISLFAVICTLENIFGASTCDRGAAVTPMIFVGLAFFAFPNALGG